MKLQNKNILLISPEPWEHIFVSKHHYAAHLAKRGNKVFFLNPPSKETTCSTTAFENLHSVNYRGFTPGLRFLPSFVQRHLIAMKFEELQKLCKAKFDIVWSFDNSVFFDFSALPKNVYSISHIVDLNQNFQFKKAAKTADICLGVINKIVKKQWKHNKNAHLISHGVQVFKEFIEPSVLPGINSIKCLYIGNLSMRFIDWEIFYQCASRHRNVDFICLGSDDLRAINKQKEKFKVLFNAYFLNEVPAVELPKYLAGANILLLAYQPQYYKEYATPHKMMEYLASGKMILATWTAEYEKLLEKGMLAMAKDRLEYLENFNSIIQHIENWNSDEKVQKRRRFALENSYEKQIEYIERILF